MNSLRLRSPLLDRRFILETATELVQSKCWWVCGAWTALLYIHSETVWPEVSIDVKALDVRLWMERFVYWIWLLTPGCPLG